MKENKKSFTLDEIKKIGKDAGIKINYKKFYNYYNSKNWLVNGDPISDMKGLITNWYFKDRKKGR